MVVITIVIGSNGLPASQRKPVSHKHTGGGQYKSHSYLFDRHNAIASRNGSISIFQVLFFNTYYHVPTVWA